MEVRLVWLEAHRTFLDFFLVSCSTYFSFFSSDSCWKPRSMLHQHDVYVGVRTVGKLTPLLPPMSER